MLSKLAVKEDECKWKCNKHLETGEVKIQVCVAHIGSVCDNGRQGSNGRLVFGEEFRNMYIKGLRLYESEYSGDGTQCTVTTM